MLISISTHVPFTHTLLTLAPIVGDETLGKKRFPFLPFGQASKKGKFTFPLQFDLNHGIEFLTLNFRLGISFRIKTSCNFNFSLRLNKKNPIGIRDFPI
jgi:hypothetical protein